MKIPDAIPDIIASLVSAIDDHRQWLMKVLQCVACRVPSGAYEHGNDGELHCLFGKWLQEIAGEPLLTELMNDADVCREHREVHILATDLISIACAPQGRCDEERYSSFVARSDHFIQTLVATERALWSQAFMTDELTGVRNRHGMMTELEREKSAHIGARLPCALVMMDLDHFKRVNDNFGHSAGDDVLRRVALEMRSRLRTRDVLFRYGGEEFLMCLPGTSQANATILVEKMRRHLNELEIPIRTGQELQVTASFGVAEMQEGRSILQDVEAADRALYEAKKSGRNCVVRAT